jgi:serine/threonine protein kinase
MCRGTPCRACPRQQLLCSNSGVSPGIVNLTVTNNNNTKLKLVVPNNHPPPCDGTVTTTSSTTSTNTSTPNNSNNNHNHNNNSKNTNNKRRASFLTHSLATRTVSFVESQVEQLTSECNFLKQVSPNIDIVQLDRSEVFLGELLGEGGFSQVHSVATIHLHSHRDDSSDNTNYNYNAHQLQVRAKIQESANTGSSRYVLKHLRPDLCSSPSATQHQQQQQRFAFHAAAADLVLEAQFLSRMGHHPYIVKLRGWATGGTGCFGRGLHDAYFLLLDHLDETLTHRIIAWRQELEEKEEVSTVIIHRYDEKLDLAIQLACALEYLHENRIVYRDLKADNVGLINNGTTVQLFDFGLARELPPSRLDNTANTTTTTTTTSHHHPANELFQMSGVGTRRYCAPEVVLGEGYNLQVDVYSLTVVLYEMMSHTKAFGMMGPESHRVLVAEGGQRPAILPTWPSSLQTLFRCGWATQSQDRPTMKVYHQDLQKIKAEWKNKYSNRNRMMDKWLFHCSHHVLPNLLPRWCRDKESCCS